MKKFLLISAAALLLISCGDNNSNDNDEELLSTDLVKNPHSAEGIDEQVMSELPVMVFDDTLHNFGTITEGENVTYEFDFVNKGNTPLIVSGAKGSCGCTVPSYPNDPIKPGEGGKIKVQFNSAGKPGHQEKSVVLTTNSNRGTHMLYIKADVEAVNN